VPKFSLIVGTERGEDQDHIIPPFLTFHRKKKRHIKKYTEGKSMRQILTQGGGWETDIKGQKIVAKNPWT
jgi:hypothetical protein